MRRNQSVLKAVAVLDGVAKRADGVTVSDLARLVEMPRVTTGRLVATLADAGYLRRRVDDDRYVLGPELARLGSLADFDGGLIAVARAPLQKVLDTFNETLTVAVPRGPASLEVIFQLDSSYFVATNWVGRDFPLHVSSAGKVLLAFAEPQVIDDFLATPLTRYTEKTITDKASFMNELEKVRARGYGELNSEFEPDLEGVSVPVTDVRDDSRLIAILSLTGPSARLNREGRRAAVNALKDAASTISGRLSSGARK